MPASLNEILNAAPVAPAAPTQTPVTEAPAAVAGETVPDEPTTEPAGAEGETNETATPAVTPEADKAHEDKRVVPIAALKDERRKRQELDRKLAELEGQVKVYSQTAKPATQEPTASPEDHFYRDPVGFIQSQLAADRLRISEDLMRDAHADYDDVVKAFVEASHTAPHLKTTLFASANPAKFAYQAGKAYLQAREYGSVDEMRAKIREELKAEVREELKRETAESAVNAVQPSLANARGTGTSPKPQWRGPTPLKQIFGR